MDTTAAACLAAGPALVGVVYLLSPLPTWLLVFISEVRIFHILEGKDRCQITLKLDETFNILINIYLLIKVQPVENIFCGFKNFINIVDAVWVTLESQVDQRYLKWYNVLWRHLWPTLVHTKQRVVVNNLQMHLQIYITST